VYALLAILVVLPLLGLPFLQAIRGREKERRPIGESGAIGGAQAVTQP
jgi:hypothetical protein